MKVLIIEDEIAAAQALGELINQVCPYAEILDVLQTIDESVEWFTENSMPDIVFMDIHLADGSSFSIFEDIDITCSVIFATAYDEYALRAFKVNSIDYLLKPINKKDLERALQKFNNLSSVKSESKLLKQFLSDIKSCNHNFKSYFLVPEKDRLIPLSVENIACIYIDSKMVKAIDYGGKIYYMDNNLDELMNQLDPSKFYRANRQYIVSRDAIKDLVIWFGNKLSINLKIEITDKILVSKARTGEFKRWFTS